RPSVTAHRVRLGRTTAAAIGRILMRPCLRRPHHTSMDDGGRPSKGASRCALWGVMAAVRCAQGAPYGWWRYNDAAKSTGQSPRLPSLAPGRKVRAPQGRVPGNAWAARADGKCNREQTADGPSRGSGKGETVR